MKNLFYSKKQILNSLSCLTILSAMLFLYNNCGAGFNASNEFSSGGGTNQNFISQCVPSSPQAKMQLHRLTNQEYIYTIKDLFNVDMVPSNFPTADQAGGSGFTNEYSRMNRDTNLSQNVSNAYFELALNTANRIITSNPSSILGLSCNTRTNACFDDFLRKLSLKVFRRPLIEPSEMTSLKNIFNAYTTFNEPAEVILATMLASPNFLYKSYGAYSAPQNQKVKLNNFELASRLSYLIWASSPDDILLTSDLSSQANVEAQIKRMLLNPKSKRLSSVFADQWLDYSKVENSSVPSEFGVSNMVLQSAKRETEEFVNHVLTQSSRVLDLWDADYSFLNASLAAHYEISGVTGTAFTKVPILNSSSGSNRGGLISQASFLINTSGGTLDTHPVSRGSWILNNVLCDTVPPPPPGVTALPDSSLVNSPRELAALHASQTSCKGCHARMDPLGFGLENYNASGKWITSYNLGKWSGRGISVVADGLLDGERFNGPGELKRLVANNPETSICMSRKIVSFALGRTMNLKDHCLSEDLGVNVISNGGSFEDVLKKIINSPSFKENGR